MEVILNVVEPESSHSYVLFEKLNRDVIKETKTVTVRAINETKTRISTSIHVGEAKYGINFPIEGYKTHTETTFSYLTGQRQEHTYFKLLKSQGVDVYKEYVKDIVRETMKVLDIELDEITVKLVKPEFFD